MSDASEWEIIPAPVDSSEWEVTPASGGAKAESKRVSYLPDSVNYVGQEIYNGMVGIPALASSLATKGINAVTGANVPDYFNSYVSGHDYKPTSTVDRYAGAVGNFVGGALVPIPGSSALNAVRAGEAAGPLLARDLVGAAGAGLGSEAAGDIVSATPLNAVPGAQMAARLTGALIGHKVAGALPNPGARAADVADAAASKITKAAGATGDDLASDISAAGALPPGSRSPTMSQVLSDPSAAGKLAGYEDAMGVTRDPAFHSSVMEGTLRELATTKGRQNYIDGALAFARNPDNPSILDGTLLKDYLVSNGVQGNRLFKNSGMDDLHDLIDEYRTASAGPRAVPYTEPGKGAFGSAVDFARSYGPAALAGGLAAHVPVVGPFIAAPVTLAAKTVMEGTKGAKSAQQAAVANEVGRLLANPSEFPTANALSGALPSPWAQRAQFYGSLSQNKDQ